jgi:hypothetical protein
MALLRSPLQSVGSWTWPVDDVAADVRDAPTVELSTSESASSASVQDTYAAAAFGDSELRLPTQTEFPLLVGRNHASGKIHMTTGPDTSLMSYDKGGNYTRANSFPFR